MGATATAGHRLVGTALFGAIWAFDTVFNQFTILRGFGANGEGAGPIGGVTVSSGRKDYRIALKTLNRV